MHNVLFQREIRPEIPNIYGALDYKKFRATLIKIDEILNMGQALAMIAVAERQITLGQGPAVVKRRDCSELGDFVRPRNLTAQRSR